MAHAAMPALMTVTFGSRQETVSESNQREQYGYQLPSYRRFERTASGI